MNTFSDGFDAYGANGLSVETGKFSPVMIDSAFNGVTTRSILKAPTLWQRIVQVFRPKPLSEVYYCFHFSPGENGKTEWSLGECVAKIPGQPGLVSVELRCWKNGEVIFDPENSLMVHSLREAES